ncbi:MAG: hypothetical protein ACRCYP_03710 [Alphaproteobacteria bacterium]
MFKLLLGAIIGGGAAFMFLNSGNVIVSRQDWSEKRDRCEAIAKQLSVAERTIDKEVSPKVRAVYQTFLKELSREEGQENR